MNRAWFVGLLVPLALLAASPSFAQDYPNRPVRVIVALSAGGTSDVFIRAVGKELLERWGQPLIVENRPGGNTIIAGKACAEAPNDGYTICLFPGETLAFNKYLFKSLPYDPLQYEPIMAAFYSISALVVNSDLKLKSIEDLVALAKAKPRTLSYMTPSVRLSLFMERLNTTRGIDIVRVPFKGGGDTANAILGGSIPIAFLGISNFISQLQAGTMTAIAVDTKQRVAILPGTPTAIEQGYPDNPVKAFFGIVAPPGTPKAITRKIRDDIAVILRDQKFRKLHMLDRGLDPIVDTPEEFSKFLADYRAASERMVKDAGLTPQ